MKARTFTSENTLSDSCHEPKVDTPSIRVILLSTMLLAAIPGTGFGQSFEVAVDYNLNKPVTSIVDESTRVSIPDCGIHHRKGAPLLPFKTAKILIPSNRAVDEILVTTVGRIESTTIKYPVEFGRTPLPVGRPNHRLARQAANDAPDRSIYDADALYPSNQVELVSIQYFHGYAVAVIRLFPVRYNPVRNQLYFSPDMMVAVKLSRSTTTSPSQMAPSVLTSHRAIVADFVDNPALLDELVLSSDFGAEPLAAYDYLLVTDAAFTNAFQPLVDQKIAGGLSVQVETIDSILSSYAGVDDAEKLRNYLIYAYDTWRIQYVLLGGDISTVPYRGAYAYVDEADNGMPCDLYFACLDGSWNSDGDTLWGEPTDGAGGGDVDLLAEVYVGRAPVDNLAEVERFVTKTVNYERNSLSNASLARFLGEYLGDYSGIHAHGGDGLDPILPHFSDYSTVWLDDRPTNGETWDASDCVAALNQSPHIVPHNGHANETYTMRLNISNLDQLTNEGLFLINSGGCYCGAFDHGDCIAEEFVKRNDHGAFAVMANSRYGWFSPLFEWMFSGEFMERFFYELLDQGTRNIGVANQLGKHHMIGSIETSGDMVYRWCYFEINLLGDPHSPLQLPDPLAVAPATGFSAQGLAGGPFLPTSQPYTVMNRSAASLPWTATRADAWISISPASGSLAAGASNTVEVSFNTGANTLATGLHTSSITFSNTVSGISQTRPVALTVREVATLPFIEDFESGALGTWWESTGTEEYRTEVTTANGPHGGSYHLTMDDSVNAGAYSRNELTLYLDLDGRENVVITFWAREYGDEPNGPPSTPFLYGANFDGVAISEDGTTWYEIRDLRNLTSTYEKLTIDLDAAIATHGLAYNSLFSIRFNHYDDYGITSDGIGIDDILIHEVTPKETIHSFPMNSDPGWGTAGQWAFGEPQGTGGDPTAGYTGSNVYGYNLGGAYSNSIPQYWLTSTALDCSAYSNVTLRFHRWLGVESASYDHAEIEASNDGSTWSSVWSHTGGSVNDSSWLEMNYDISAIADGQPAVLIRWGMGPTDSSVTYSGWNIDDVTLEGCPITTDTDVDGIPDWWEELYFGHCSNCLWYADDDFDGQNNRDEYIAGMCPTNPASVFMITNSIPVGDDFMIEWPSVSERVYRSLWAANLTNDFQTMESNIFHPRNSSTDTTHGAHDRGFYQVEVELR